ncbi:unnamed protein product, partial [Symbiodinium sp. CCMP2456]
SDSDSRSGSAAAAEEEIEPPGSATVPASNTTGSHAAQRREAEGSTRGRFSPASTFCSPAETNGRGIQGWLPAVAVAGSRTRGPGCIARLSRAGGGRAAATFQSPYHQRAAHGDHGAAISANPSTEHTVFDVKISHVPKPIVTVESMWHRQVPRGQPNTEPQVQVVELRACPLHLSFCFVDAQGWLAHAEPGVLDAFVPHAAAATPLRADPAQACCCTKLRAWSTEWRTDSKRAAASVSSSRWSWAAAYFARYCRGTVGYLA